jgi:hypothetical protein
MNDKKIVRAAVLAACFSGLVGCASVGKPTSRPGEPSPREDIASVDEPETLPVADAGDAITEAEKSAEAPPPAAEPATEAPPPAAEPVTEAPVAAAPAPPPAEVAQPERKAAPTPPAPRFQVAEKPQIIAKVEKVQFPAWVNRRGIKAAIKAGWAIYTGDRIITGANGRVLLGVAGEGQLKIAGKTDLSFTEAMINTGDVEPSLMTLNHGAFHFTAPMVRASNAGMPIEIRGAITANLLGGQLFARSDGTEDMILLMDGIVEVSGPKLNPGKMSQPQTYLRVPRQGRAQPVNSAPQERVASWLSATEPVSGTPELEASGTWDVSMNSGYNLKQLETMACQLQSRGYPTELYPVREPGKQVWYRVVVRRFKSKNDAVEFLGTARALGAKEPWVLIPQT